LNEVESFDHLNLSIGPFNLSKDVPDDSNILLYERLHGCVSTGNVNLVDFVDLKVDFMPVINLEWIKKIARHTGLYGYLQ